MPLGKSPRGPTPRTSDEASQPLDEARRIGRGHTLVVGRKAGLGGAQDSRPPASPAPRPSCPGAAVSEGEPRELDIRPIGRVRTPFATESGTPIQSAYARGAKGRVLLDDAFGTALDDIDGFERLWLIYWMHRVVSFRPRVVPYRDTRERGLFATRSPCRPNPIGLSVVRLVRREGCVLHVADVDMLDNSPLLDIKPYVPDFDAHSSSRAGWFDGTAVDRRVADDRFYRSGGRS